MVEALALTVVSNLLVPYVKDGAEALGKAVAEKARDQAAGQKAVEVAKKAWDLVRGAFNDAADKPVLEQFEKRPEATEPLLREILQEKIDQNPQLASALQSLRDTQVTSDGTTGAQIIGATYAGIADARGAHIENGNVTGLHISGPPPFTGERPSQELTEPRRNTDEVP